MKLDNLHYSLNKMLSYNKAFNFVISAREAGKSTAIWLFAYKKFLKGETTLVIRRLLADITETYIDDISKVINKFIDKPIKLWYKKGELDDGIVTVSVNYGDDKHPDLKPFFRVVALSNPMSRIKSLMFPNLRTILFDEFICNTIMKEKYLDNEVFRFKEVFNTFQRESEKLTVIFAGNPYSLYNPYFVSFGVPTKELYAGNIVVGGNWVVEVYQITDELRAAILAKNPLYQFDDAYTKYAFDGRSIRDSQIKIVEKCPDNYRLRYVFFIQGKILGIFRNTSTDFRGDYNFFWVGVMNGYNSERREITCFNFNDLADGTCLISTEDKRDFNFLKDCFRTRTIIFKSIEENYMFEAIYNLI